jgi:hypothetical protein
MRKDRARLLTYQREKAIGAVSKGGVSNEGIKK